MSSASHLHGLNPEQREAVLHTDGPVLVLAGAGSGKTRMLVHRIAHLIRAKQAEPSQVLAVTFTNRAADEMRERVRAFAGDAAKDVVISTFHSLGVRILREHGDRLGLPRRFAIYDTRDQLGALKTATSEIRIDDDRFDLARVLRRISDWKTRGVAPERADREVAAEAMNASRADEYDLLAAQAYGRYEEVLRACGAVDFDDLLLLPVRLLAEDEEARRAVWKRWRYVMIDEYQDTSGVQLDMARHLAGARRNLCVVGDDDQSIYAFRGADVSNILDFERHFPGAKVIYLEQNYRSTKKILAAANAVIAGNAHRHPKALRTENPEGPPLDLYEHEDDALEAETVAKEIGLRRYRNGTAWKDYAVLYRANVQSRVLEEAMRERNVPYRVVGSTGFFERKEVADGVAYLRAVAHPEDEIAVRRIINTPARGVGRTTVLRVSELARERRRGFCGTLRRITDEDVGAAQAKAIRGFEALLDRARKGLHEAEERTAHHPPGTGLPPIAAWAMDLFRDRTGLLDSVSDDEHRVINLKDLVGALARYERRRWIEKADAGDGWEPPTLHDALARLALDSEEEDEDDAEKDAVVLMTLHSAKGLEFDEVFLVGLEEGIIPHSRSLVDESAGAVGGAADPLAEERRLLYVGLTRARRRVTLSRCVKRKRGGESIESLPSRYLDEIPDELLAVKTAEQILSAEESAELKRNFFRDMKELLSD
ncbi:MAG TPA: UvrD-helicase domain-containing protein [Longimicrobiales bacterium]|nr:UvrD-helicase domain-containing protein [Longimicrobiales bacterium]